MSGFTTRSVHGERRGPEAHGSLRFPLYDSAAFEADSAKDHELTFANRLPKHSYTRLTNPTIEDYERRVQWASGATGVLSTASGMAAIADACLALVSQGSNIVTSKRLFSHTISLFKDTFGRFGVETRWVDMLDPAQVAAAIDADTRLVFLEVLTNPQLEVADIQAIAKIAGAKGVPVVLDNTMATPYLFDAKAHGVAVEVVSATKFLSGGASVMGGLILDHGTFDWKKAPNLELLAAKVGPAALIARLRRDTHRNLGTCLSPHNAWQLTLGLETLALRADRSCANALAVARHLEGLPKVVKVHYPGLPSSPFFALSRRQFPRGAGAVLTFDLPGKAEAFRVLDAFRVVRRATNLNDNKSLAIHAASTIFADLTPEERAANGIGEGLIRLSVGIEDPEDLFEDLDQALEKA